MGMIDCRHCGEPVAEDAANCPHCGEAIQAQTAPRWYQILIAVISIGIAYWFYELLSTATISILGALAGVALYAGAVWIYTGTAPMAGCQLNSCLRRARPSNSERSAGMGCS